MRPKAADGMAKRVDPDEPALLWQSYLGLHCLPRHVACLSESLGLLLYVVRGACLESVANS